MVIGCLMVINKASNESFKVQDIKSLTVIASHVALNMEGQFASIKKVLQLASDQKSMMQKSADYTRTASLAEGNIVGVDVDEDSEVEGRWEEDEVRGGLRGRGALLGGG